jgi:HEPN domain-containing protein
MSKETAVEWFVKELFKKIDYIQVDPKLIEQAIAMEKEQIMNAYLEGESDADHYEDSASRFYNETYGGDK